MCKPVHYTKTVEYKTGRWENQCYEVPGPIVTKCVADVGPCDEAIGTVDDACAPATCAPVKMKRIQVQCPPVKCFRKVWVPMTCTREVQCVKYVTETCVKTCTYKVCKMVPEQRTCTYTVCKMVPEQRVKTCTYKVCKMVPEQRVRTCTYKVCRMVAEQCTKEVQYTVMKPVCVEKTVMDCKLVAKQVPYTVTKCVPKVVTYQVPVQVLVRQPKVCVPAACAPAACEPADNCQ